jgi:hypothetical protein
VGGARGRQAGTTDEKDTDEVAAKQVLALVERLPEPEAVPIFVFDAGYDPVKLQRALEGCLAKILLRLHSNRDFYAAPEEVEPRPAGRPPRHGKRFDLKDPASWPEPPTREHRCQSDDYGSVRLRCWAGLHPKSRHTGERYGCKRAPVVRGCVVLVEVDKLPRQTRKPKKLWLCGGAGRARWTSTSSGGRTLPQVRPREHTIRFMKQTLGWTTPRVPHPEQADRDGPGWYWPPTPSSEAGACLRRRREATLGASATASAVDPDPRPGRVSRHSWRLWGPR